MLKIVVVGGTGRIGSIVTSMLERRGHDVVTASPSTGVDAATGTGLTHVMSGADIVIDVSKPHTYEDAAVLRYFTTATRRIIDAEHAAGVRHHVMLTTVGARAGHGIGYYEAKFAAEEIVLGSDVPSTLVRSTQFFEFFGTIADASMRDDVVRLPRALVQPIAAHDTAEAVVEAATMHDPGGEVEVAGPDVLPLDEFVRRGLDASGDPRLVIRDPAATYFGGHPGERDLLPNADAHLFTTRFDQWLTATHTKEPVR